MVKKLKEILLTHEIISLILLYILTRAITLIPVYLSFYSNYGKRLPPAPSWYLTNKQGPLNYHWYNALFFYDSTNYAYIGLNGYAHKFYTMWMPLYPILIKIASLISKHQELISVIISNIFYIGCFALFYLFEKNRLASIPKAFVSVFLFGIFPGSVYFSCAYSESIALFFTLMAFYTISTNKSVRNTILSAIFSGLGVLSRMTSVVLPLSIILDNFKTLNTKKKILYLIISFAGFIGLLVFFQLKFGSFLVFAKEQNLVYNRLFIPFYKLFYYEYLYIIAYGFAVGVSIVVFLNMLFLLIAICSLFDKDSWIPRWYTLLSVILIANTGLIKGSVDPMFGIFRYTLLVPSIYTFISNLFLKSITSKVFESKLVAGIITLFLFFNTAMIGYFIGMKLFLS